MVDIASLLGINSGPTNTPVQVPTAALPDISSPTDAAPVHKGLFGIHGTARDVLGLIGDALSGNHYYAKTKEQEKLGDAMQGFTDDPLGAIKRVSAVNPTVAANLYEDYTKNQIQKQTADALASYRQAQGQVQASKRIGAMGNALTPENYTKMLPIISNYAKQWGLDLPEAPSAYSDDYKGLLQNYGMDPYQAQSLEETTRHHGVQEDLGKTRVENQRDYQQGQLGLGEQRVAISRDRAANSSSRTAGTQSLQEKRLEETIRHNKAMESRPTRGAATGNSLGLVAVKGPDGKYHIGRK